MKTRLLCHWLVTVDFRIMTVLAQIHELTQTTIATRSQPDMQYCILELSPVTDLEEWPEDG